MNKVFLSGRLGSDSDIKAGNGSSSYTLLNIATTSGYYDANKKWIEQTQWHYVIANWSVDAKKGDLVMVEGELVYYTASDGIKKSQVRAKYVKAYKTIGGQQRTQEAATYEAVDVSGDDLPF
jgi:single-stranded DNA-binding protein